jgi:capsule biosynthesis phosphatase
MFARVATELAGGKPPFTLPTGYYTKFTGKTPMIPDPTKTIVMDVDDTILTTVNRDYANSQPKMEVVKGMRALKEAGWFIYLYTARGMGRSNGDIASVADDVFNEVEAFCKKFDVPYDAIQVGKPWGCLYVDDLAMRPEEFAARYDRIIEEAK